MTHLLYADYTIIFCEAEQKQLCHIRIILVIFEACSGLKVNWRKSSIFHIKEVQQIQALANILKCKIERLPTVYLGMPLGAKHKAVSIWDDVLRKSERRLALWKSQYLFFGGRVTLINFVLRLFANICDVTFFDSRQGSQSYRLIEEKLPLAR